MDLLLTGAGGFLGPLLVQGLAAGGHGVTAIHRGPPPEALRRLAGAGDCRLVQADLMRKLDIEARPDAIIHAAARPVASPAAEHAGSVETTRRVVEFALRAGVGRIVFLSASRFTAR